MSLINHKLQRFGLWLAGDEVRVIRAEEYARGYREGVTDGMAIEAQEQERREVERLPDVTPEPHDACTSEASVALLRDQGAIPPNYHVNPDQLQVIDQRGEHVVTVERK